MRVIRTELLYQESDLNPLKMGDDERGVTVAWSTVLAPVFVAPNFIEGLIEDGIIESVHPVADIRRYLDDTLSGGSSYQFEQDGEVIQLLDHSDVVEQVLRASIVIEHSPPVAEPLSALLAKATPLAGGLYLGIQLAGGNTILLVTVPVGILLVGTAVAVTKAIEAGLMRIVTGRGRPKSRRRRRRRAVDDDRGSNMTY